MAKKVNIACYWNGPELGWMERLSLTSFIHFGFDVTLFSPSANVSGVVDGVVQANYRDVCEFPPSIAEQAAGSFQADLFRIYLQKNTDLTWMDSDIVALRSFEMETDYLLSKIDPNVISVNNATLRVPKSSPALALLLEHIENPEKIPVWIRAKHQQELERTPVPERLLKLSQLLRTAFGPAGWTYACKLTGEVDFAQESVCFSPISWTLTDLLFDPRNDALSPWITEETNAVHMFSAQVRRWHRRHPLPKGSFLHRLAVEFDFENYATI